MPDRLHAWPIVPLTMLALAAALWPLVVGEWIGLLINDYLL